MRIHSNNLPLSTHSAAHTLAIVTHCIELIQGLHNDLKMELYKYVNFTLPLACTLCIGFTVGVLVHTFGVTEVTTK